MGYQRYGMGMDPPDVGPRGHGFTAAGRRDHAQDYGPVRRFGSGDQQDQIRRPVLRYKFYRQLRRAEHFHGDNVQRKSIIFLAPRAGLGGGQ